MKTGVYITFFTFDLIYFFSVLLDTLTPRHMPFLVDLGRGERLIVNILEHNIYLYT